MTGACIDVVKQFMTTNKRGNILLRVVAHPSSRMSGVKIGEDGVHVYLESPPEGGRANSELVKMFRRKYSLRVSIYSGVKSRDKLIEVQEGTLDDVA
ncbi:MAG: DUF167 domain-containing protein, partial [Desulfurococcales archaeon]|nr:DUF167 domain-containing protein [Desulfurococcales archaeon]